MPTIMPQIAKQILSGTDAGIKDISEDARDVSDDPIIHTKNHYYLHCYFPIILIIERNSNSFRSMQNISWRILQVLQKGCLKPCRFLSKFDLYMRKKYSSFLQQVLTKL